MMDTDLLELVTLVSVEQLLGVSLLGVEFKTPEVQGGWSDLGQYLPNFHEKSRAIIAYRTTRMIVQIFTVLDLKTVTKIWFPNVD